MRSRTRSTAAALLATVTLTLAGAATASAQTDVDTTIADFDAGASAQTYVAPSGLTDGDVLLNPAVGEEFQDGPALPADWSSSPWSGGGSADVTGGSLVVDGASAGTTATYAPGRWLEFVATFGSAEFQHVGFGVDFNAGPWAMFSTGGVSLPFGLYARTLSASGTADFTPVAFDPLVSHRYRIVWTETDVTYFVDDVLVATHTIPLTAEMRPLASDFDFAPSGPAVTVDWLHMGPYATEGTFTSRVFDAGDTRTVWQTVTADAETPADTSVSLQTRTGPSATPEDGSWSSWQAVGSGGSIASPIGRRYAQYRAILTTPDPAVTPVLHAVTIVHEVDAAAPATTIDKVTVSGTTARVEFSSDPDASFECSLDGEPFRACTSPHEYSGLAAGNHTARARATDHVGNVGAAAERSFTIAAPAMEQPPASEPPTTHADSSAPRIRPQTRSATASRAGKVRLVLTCPATETRCRIALKLRYRGRTIASKSVSVDGDDVKSVTLKLQRSARISLGRKGKLTVHALTTARDAAGNIATTDTRIKLRAPK